MFPASKPTLLWDFVFEGSWPMAATFVGPTRKVVAGNQLGQIFVWEVPEAPSEVSADEKKDGKQAPNLAPVRRLDGHTNGITRLLSTPDGKYVISASLDRTIRLWPMDAAASGSAEVILDEQTRKNQAKRSGKKEPSNAPGAKVETQTECEVLSGHEDWIEALAISRDGHRLISGDTKSRVIVWDIAAKKEISRWSGHSWNWINSVALNANGTSAVVAESRYKRDDFDIPSASVKVFDASSGNEKLDILKTQFPKLNPKETSYGGAQLWRKFIAGGLVAADFSPDGKLIALGQGGETDKGQVHLIDAETGKLVRDVSGHQYGITDVRFSADGKHVLSAGRDTMVRICQVSDGKEIAALGTSRGGQFKDWISSIALSADQKLLVGSDIAGLVHIWSVE